MGSVNSPNLFLKLVHDDDTPRVDLEWCDAHQHGQVAGQFHDLHLDLSGFLTH